MGSCSPGPCHARCPTNPQVGTSPAELCFSSAGSSRQSQGLYGTLASSQPLLMQTTRGSEAALDGEGTGRISLGMVLQPRVARAAPGWCLLCYPQLKGGSRHKGFWPGEAGWIRLQILSPCRLSSLAKVFLGLLHGTEQKPLEQTGTISPACCCPRCSKVQRLVPPLYAKGN